MKQKKYFKDYNYILLGYFKDIEDLVSDVMDYIFDNTDLTFDFTGTHKNVIVAVAMYNILDRLGFKISKNHMSKISHISRDAFSRVDAKFRKTGVMEHLNKQINIKDFNIILKRD